MPCVAQIIAGAMGGTPVRNRFFYGGQAVIEGVMMRGREALGIAVRRPDSTVAVHEERHCGLGGGFPVLKWPLVRGAVALVEAMFIGIRALNFSANQQVARRRGEELGFKELAFTFPVAIANRRPVHIVARPYYSPHTRCGDAQTRC